MRRLLPRGLELLESRRLLHAGQVHEIVLDDPEIAVVPDFSLIDTNATSTTYNQPVSPTDYRGSISGWYFGHAS